MSASRKQVQLLHIAKGQLGLSDERYRGLLLEYGSMPFVEGKEGPTSLGLNEQEADDLLAHFKYLGFKVKKKRQPRKPPNMETMLHARHPMFQKIEHLRADINWKYLDGFQRLAMKVIKKERPATTREAAKLIEALKGMKANQQRKAAHGN